MNKNSLRLAAFSLPLLAMAAAPARAAFDPSIVPADAQWVFYLDLNALRTSAIGQEAMKMVPKVDIPADELPVSVNIPKIIESIGSTTAYGTSFSKDPKALDGALVIKGTDDLRKIVEAFLVQATVSGEDMGDVKVTEAADLGVDGYRINDEVIVAFPPESGIVVTKSKERLAAARALMKNDRTSMARSKSTLAPLITDAAKHFFVAASVVPRGEDFMPKDGPHARILQMASAASVALGQDKELTVARIQIDATSSDTADKLIKILQGVVAMLSFAETDDKALGDFLRSVQVEKTASGARVNLAYPTERLVQMLHTLQEKGDHHRQAHRGEDEKPPAVEGRVIGEWKADSNAGGDAPTPQNLLTHTVENIPLVTGSTLWLNGRRHNGEHARWDYLEISPSDGSAAPLRFEAENMRLHRYRPESAPFASAGEVIRIENGSGSARLIFPGAAGTYTLKAAYIDESDGETTFSISLAEPKPQPGPEAAPTASP